MLGISYIQCAPRKIYKLRHDSRVHDTDDTSTEYNYFMFIDFNDGMTKDNYWQSTKAKTQVVKTKKVSTK